MEPESSEHVKDSDAPLVGPGFEYNNRPVRDVVWTVFFVLLAVLVCGFAVYAGIEKDSDASQLFHQDYHKDPGYCTDQNITEPEVELASIRPESNGFLEFLEQGWVWILISTFAAVAVGFIFVLLFSYFAMFMVYFVAATLIFVPIIAGIINIVAYDNAWGWAFVAVGVVIAIPILCLRSQLNLTAKLLDLGADGLRDNLDLVFFSICANFVLLALFTGMLCFGILALTNGKMEVNDSWDQERYPNECRTLTPIPRSVDCCDWNMDNWVTGYWVLLVILMLWTAFLIDQIKVFVVAGVISQWYFADDNTRGNMSIMKSLGFAMGPSFGSLVLASLILTISNIVRRISEYLTKRAQEENSRFKWLITCLACLINAIAFIIEWVTDFATVRMAITGESFFQAGKNVIQMMKENLLNAYAIWWFPPIVLYFLSFLIAGSVSTILALSAHETWDDDHDLVDVRTWSWYIFIICFLLTIIVLHFFSTLLIDAVNTIFICFAIEKSNKTTKNAKAHDVFEMVIGMSQPAGIEGVQQVQTRAVVFETDPPTQEDPPRV